MLGVTTLTTGCPDPNCTNPTCVELRENKNLFFARKIICDVCEWSYVGLDWKNQSMQRCKWNGLSLECFVPSLSSTCTMKKW